MKTERRELLLELCSQAENEVEMQANQPLVAALHLKSLFCHTQIQFEGARSLTQIRSECFALGMTWADLERNSRLSQRVIESLENEDFERLPRSGTYVSGYCLLVLKCCYDFLGADVNMLFGKELRLEIERYYKQKVPKEKVDYGRFRKNLGRLYVSRAGA